MSASGVRSFVPLANSRETFFFFFFSLFFLRPIHERESPLRRYSTSQWVLIDRSLGGPFERGHNAKWREIGGWLVGRRGGDQGGRKKKRKKKREGSRDDSFAFRE